MDFSPLFADPEDLQSQALVEALRKQQQRGEAARSGLQESLARQQGQAGGLRTLSLLSSLGSNPLLQGIQQASGQQGAQMEGLAARTEQRLGQADEGINPLRAFALRLQAEKENRLAGDAEDREKRLREQLDFQKGRAGAAATSAKDKAESAAAAMLRKGEDDIRKEFTSLPDVKEFAPFDTAYKSLGAALRRPGGVGSTAAVFSFMKLIDPGVAVMEGDVERIRASAGPAAKFADLYQYVKDGNTLPESVRAELQGMADELYAVRKGKYESRRKQYGGLAKDRGITPEKVLPPDIDLDAPAVPVPPGGPGTRNRFPEPSGTAGTVRVKIDGEPYDIPRKNLDAAKARAKAKGYTFEVYGG